MTWTKTPDDFPDRLLDVSDAAYRLHHAATTHSNRLGTDGRITKSRLSVIPVPERTRRPSVIAELVAAGLWREDGDGYVLTDFFEAQPSAEEVRTRQRYDAARQALRYARTRHDSPERIEALKDDERERRDDWYRARDARKALSHSESHSESPSDSHGPDPSPSRPAPKDEDGDKKTPPSPSAPEARSGGVADGEAVVDLEAVERVRALGASAGFRAKVAAAGGRVS